MNTFNSNNVNYRYELKYLISSSMAEILKYRLSLFMEKDENSSTLDNKYYIRSLYYDDIYDTAYNEKIDGLEEREKYRIRIYNLDPTYILIELKGKKGDFTYKKQDVINRKEYEFIVNKEYDKIKIGHRKILDDFINKCKSKNLIPSVIVDYTREAFTYPVADVRITFDEDISSGRFDYDLLDEKVDLHRVIEPNEVILEVKYNDRLPRIVKEIINTIPITRIAISKFTYCKEKKEL